MFTGAQDLGKIDAEVQKQIGTSLTTYYRLKNSLVAGNAEIAGKRAGELNTTLETVDASKMTDAQKVVWEKLRVSLVSDVTRINESKDLETQRKHFIQFSNNMYAFQFQS